MKHTFLIKAVDILLKCYPQAWQKRFGDQVRADMEESLSEQGASMKGLLGWSVLCAWDLTRGAAIAHISANRKKKLVLSLAGGESVSMDQVDTYEALKIVIRELPFILIVGSLFIAAGISTGLGLYDARQYAWHGAIGVLLTSVFGALFFKKAEKNIALAVQGNTQQCALSITVVSTAIFLACVYLYLFGFIEGEGRQASINTPSISIKGVLGMSDTFIFLIVGQALLGLFFGGVLSNGSPPSKIITIALMIVLAASAYCFSFLAAVDLWVSLAFPLFVFVILVIVLMKKTLPRWISKTSFAMLFLSIPLLLGFLLGMVIDLGYRSEELNGKFGMWVSVPTLREQAHEYQSALDAVRQKGNEVYFWHYLDQANHDRMQWQKNKPWVSLLNTKPVGISALDWCLASSNDEPSLRVARCMQTSSPDEWMTTSPKRASVR